jgi:hypothetical protein
MSSKRRKLETSENDDELQMLQDKLAAVIKKMEQQVQDSQAFQKESKNDPTVPIPLTLEVGNQLLHLNPNHGTDDQGYEYTLDPMCKGAILRVNDDYIQKHLIEDFPALDATSFKTICVNGKPQKVMVDDCDTLNSVGDQKNGFGYVVVQLSENGFKPEELHLLLERVDDGVQNYRVESALYKLSPAY